MHHIFGVAFDLNKISFLPLFFFLKAILSASKAETETPKKRPLLFKAAFNKLFQTPESVPCIGLPLIHPQLIINYLLAIQINPAMPAI
jgi:hypothetical protein